MRAPIASAGLLRDVPEFTGFPLEGDRFLEALGRNNDRRWFNEHREEYERYILTPMRAFVLDAGARLQEKVPRLVADPRVGGSLFRIARDTRFARDKRPFKTWSAARLWDGAGPGRELSPGFYIHVEAEGIYVGGGLYRFEDDALDRYREALNDARALKALRAALGRMKDLELGPPDLQRLPRGFPADHPAGELARHKGIYAGRMLDRRRARSARCLDAAMEVYEQLLPLNRWLMAWVVGVK